MPGTLTLKPEAPVGLKPEDLLREAKRIFGANREFDYFDGARGYSLKDKQCDCGADYAEPTYEGPLDTRPDVYCRALWSTPAEALSFELGKEFFYRGEFRVHHT